MRRLNPTALAAAVLGLVLLIVLAIYLARRGESDQDKLSDQAASGAAESAPQTRCARQATYDRIKDELFRQAAQLRQSDRSAFDRLSAYASVRVERPLMRSQDAELGTVRCSGSLSLDLPPGVAVVGGRRTLSADIDYVLQPAADGSGDVVMLEGADAIVVPLATLARTGETAPPPVAPPPPARADALPPPGDQPQTGSAAPVSPSPAPIARAPAPDRAEPVRGSARPSFNCRYARTRGEIAVCRDPGLAALDRQMASQYYRAIATADRRQRAILTATRDSFLRFRDRCPNDSCIAETYQGRIREIADIMAGRWQPGG